MSKIFTYQFRGKRTGWDYKLVFTPSGASELETPEEVVLPRGSVGLKKTSWKFDKLPLGLRSAKTLEAEIDISLLAHTTFDDFVTMLYNPITEITRTISGYSNTYYVGSVVELYIKFNRNSEVSVNVWRNVFTGTIREDQEVEATNSMKNIYTVTAEDVGRSATDSIGFRGISAVSTIDDVERDGYCEFYANTSPKRVIFQKPGFDMSVLFQPLTVLENYIKAAYQALLRDTMRDQSITAAFELPLPTLYKQIYTGYTTRGAELTKADLFIASTLFYQEVTDMGGFTHAEDEFGLNKSYQSIWDFLSDHLESNLRKGWFDGATFYSTTIFGQIGATRIHAIDSKKVNIKYNQASQLLKKVVASIYERHGDKVKDMDNVNSELPASRNAGEYSLPTLLMPQPTQSFFVNNAFFREDSTQAEDFMDEFGVSTSDKHWLGDQVRRQCYFYKEASSPITNTLGEFFRVHHAPRYAIAPGITSDDLYPFISENLTTFNDANVVIAQMQVESSAPVIVSNALLKIFSDRIQHKIKIEANIDYLTDFQPGGGAGFVWDAPDSIFELNLGDIDSRKVMTKEHWHIISSEIDYENETASVEALLRSI